MMPYQVTFTNRKTGKTLISRYESYTPAYRALSELAYAIGYEVHSVHGESLVTAGTQTSEFFIVLEKTNHVSTHIHA